MIHLYLFKIIFSEYPFDSTEDELWRLDHTNINNALDELKMTYDFIEIGKTFCSGLPPCTNIIATEKFVAKYAIYVLALVRRLGSYVFVQ